MRFSAFQEEYRKGVSSWNFDLAALKAQAALEPDDDTTHSVSLLPTITESDEREETMTGASAAAAAQFVAAQAMPLAFDSFTSRTCTSVFGEWGAEHIGKTMGCEDLPNVVMGRISWMGRT